MPREEKIFFRLSQDDTDVDVYEGSEVIIITAKGVEVKDYKQGDYNRVSDTGYIHDENTGEVIKDDRMKESVPIKKPELQEVNVKNNRTFECFSYELSLSSKNYFKGKDILSEFSLIEELLDDDDDSKNLHKLYKEKKLYYKDSLNRTFNSSDKNARKRVISKAEKEAKIEYKKRFPYGTDTDFEMDKGTYVALSLSDKWLPEFKIPLFPRSSYSPFLNLFSYQEDAIDKLNQTYYIKTLEWRDYKNDYIKQVENYWEFDNVYRYNLPNLYTLKRTYYTKGQKDYNRIATQGCLITCYADIITYYYHKNNYRKAQNPHDVKDRMQKMDIEHSKDQRKPQGFRDATPDMMNDNVAIDYGLKHDPKDEVIKVDIDGKKKVNHDATSKMFLEEIKKRINQDLPTIARLSLGDAKHYVVVVGLKYDENNNAVEYIINDPGRKEYMMGSDGKPTKELRKYTINCKSRVYEHSKKKMDKIYFLDIK